MGRSHWLVNMSLHGAPSDPRGARPRALPEQGHWQPPFGGGEAIGQPARLAGVPGLVGSDHVERASARLLLLPSVGQAAGFALAGALIAVVPDPRSLFLVDAVAFAVAGLLVMSAGSLGGGVTKVKLSGSVFRALASPNLRPHLVVAGVVALLTTMLAPSLLPLSYELSGDGVTVY